MAKKSGAQTKKTFFGKGGGAHMPKAPASGGMTAGLKKHGAAGHTTHQIKPATPKKHADRKGTAKGSKIKMPSAMG